MNTSTLHRVYIGGRYGKPAGPDQGKLIHGFEAEVLELASSYLEGATVQFVTGIWQGDTEPAAIIETLIDHARNVEGETAQVLALALKAKEQFKQDSVLHVTTETNHRFI